MTAPSPDTGPTQSTGAPVPLGALIGIVVVALVGVALLGYALLTLFANPASPAAPTAAPSTAVAATTAGAPTDAPAGAAPSATAAILIPTVTSAPAQPPTDTPAPATDSAPAPTAAPTGPVLTIILPANVRSGPGTNYSILGGLDTGSTPEIVGRDSAATWYVINYLGGRGWVSNQVSQYTGDINALSVVAAPPPPAATATPVPPTSAPAPTSAPQPTAPAGNSQGIRVDYFLLTNNITQILVNQPFQFKFKITNTASTPLSFAGLGAIALPGGPAQPSWSTTTSNTPIKPGETLEWEDNMTIKTAGNYKIYLGLCAQGSQESCENPAGWVTLSGGIDLAVR